MDDKRIMLKDLYQVMLKAEGKVGGGEGLMGCYGSITRTGMSKVLGALSLHAGLSKDSVLLDIGSGLGRPLLHALVEAQISHSYGVELDPVKCQKAIPFIKHTLELMQKSGHQLAAASMPCILCTPVEELSSLEPASHAYAAWEGFPIDVMMAIGRLFSASRTLKAIAIVQRSFRQCDPAAEMEGLGFGAVKLVDSFAVMMSGSGRQLNAYVFVKEPSVTSHATRFNRLGAPGPSLATIKAFDPASVTAMLAAQGSSAHTTGDGASAMQQHLTLHGPRNAGLVLDSSHLRNQKRSADSLSVPMQLTDSSSTARRHYGLRAVRPRWNKHKDGG